MSHPDSTVHSSGDPAVHVFAVDEVFKGDVHQQQGVVSADSGGSCGLELSGTGPFVVFATRAADGTTLTADLCGGTAPAAAALAADLRSLTGTPAAPRPGDDVPSGTGAEPGTAWVPALAVSGAAALLLLALFAMRRRIPSHR